MAKVKVYFFTKYDITTDKIVKSKRPATKKAIAQVGGKEIKESVLEIDQDELDETGFRKT